MHKDIKKALEVLKKGGVVAYPTDTAYGFAVDATNPAAVKRLFHLKGRNFQNPVHVIPPTREWIEKTVKLNSPAKKLIDNLMPGPLTLVLPLKISGKSWKMLSAGTKTLGIRRPKNKLALDLANLFGKPITTTSANLSGKPPTYSVVEIKKQFKFTPYKPDFYLDGGRLPKIKPSTVVLVKKDVKILRPGPITEKKIKQSIK